MNAEHGNLKERAAEELKSLLYISLFFLAFLGAINIYTRVMLKEHGIPYIGLGFSAIEALILAKVILLGDAMKLGRASESRSLINTVLSKSVLFGGFAYVLAIVERVIEGLIHKLDWEQIVHKIFEHGFAEIFAKTLVVFVGFVSFFAFWELRRRMGHKEFVELWLGDGGAPKRL
jgi:hypothetical protein